ncbi:uncharacterized protein EAF02_006965 [Botrytis sinoallii]|uniref:uncharacterized protein n=1 Tax=Botrytis sinoallii TaxID=1463999 RepID=UPI0018FFBB90|nr:uncharacterized protein EAF02_006965 [Botrytis sinoallii]KAF7881074.1 hypothetical protein EAF02_006965 [Botrytis sinoallii]
MPPMSSAAIIDTPKAGPLAFKSQPPPIILSKEISNTINDRAMTSFFLLTYFGTLVLSKDIMISLAAYAYAFKYPFLLQKATQSFGYALHLVNEALTSIEEATKDYTIISVVLFNTFGVLTFQNLDTLMDCDSHISGATSMLKLRGFRQMETRHGLQLFFQMNSILLQSCIWHSFRVPDDLIELQKHAAGF